MRKPITVLLVNKSPSLAKVFETALVGEGFNVIPFFKEAMPSYKPSTYSRIINILKRFVLKKKNHFLLEKEKKYHKKLIQLSNDLVDNIAGEIDFALIFRGDLYPEEVIKNFRKISRTMVSYQYDGLEVSSKIIDYRNYFDRIFVFDKYDYRKYGKYGFLPLTNCWFEDNNDKKAEALQDFYYLGVGVDERKEKILRLQNYTGNEFSLKAILTVPEFREEKKTGSVQFVHQGLSYEENIENVKSSNVIIDFKLPYHEGLSFRFLKQ